jgi:regulator of sigma E protease
MSGDEVLTIGGVRIAKWEALQKAVASHKPNESVRIDITRDGTSRTLTVTLRARADTPTVAFLGVGPGEEHQRLPVIAAVQTSFSYIGLTFVAIADFFNPARFSASVGNARSIVGISYEVARAAQAGPFEYAWLVAVLSLSLGVMNILPIPPLDGGKVIVELIEALVRRPIPRRISYALSGIGALLLFSLIFYLMYADVMRYVVQGS